MTSTSVARRYARALMTIGTEDGRFEAYADELERVRSAFDSSPELRDLWLNPAYGRESRLAAVDRLAPALSLSPTVANLLRLLVERQRATDLVDIARAYRQLCDEKVGRVRAVVTTAVAMPPEVTSRIGQALAEMTKKQIVLEARVDPKLLGGVVAQVGSTVLDGSLATQLEQLRQTMHQGRAS